MYAPRIWLLRGSDEHHQLSCPHPADRGPPRHRRDDRRLPGDARFPGRLRGRRHHRLHLAVVEPHDVIVLDLIERGALGKSRNYIRRRSILRERESVYG